MSNLKPASGSKTGHKIIRAQEGNVKPGAGDKEVCIISRRLTGNEGPRSFPEKLTDEETFQNGAQRLELSGDGLGKGKDKGGLKNRQLLTQLDRAKKGLEYSKSIIHASGEKRKTTDKRLSSDSQLNELYSQKIQLVFADDDDDDRMLFKKALDDLPLNTNLTTVNGGEELMVLLEKEYQDVPTLLFLDLNMPGKNGFECLAQIKNNKKLMNLSIMVLSGSVDSKDLDLLRKNGAHRYIHKPLDFSKLKLVIYDAIKESISSFPMGNDFLFQY